MSMLPQREQHRLQLREVIKEFQRFPGDVGSSEVQGEGKRSMTWRCGTSVLCFEALLTFSGIVEPHGCYTRQVFCCLHTSVYLNPPQPHHRRQPWAYSTTTIPYHTVARLTRKIHDLAEHLKMHRKDHSSRRGLQGLLSQRRSLLQYLRRSNFDTYAMTISKLGLKDNYAQHDRFTVRYKPLVRSSANA